jgi:hypothetical protein
VTYPARETALEALRRDYPAWTIGVSGSRWIAFFDNGTGQQIHCEREDPVSLRARLDFLMSHMLDFLMSHMEVTTP